MTPFQIKSCESFIHLATANPFDRWQDVCATDRSLACYQADLGRVHLLDLGREILRRIAYDIIPLEDYTEKGVVLIKVTTDTHKVDNKNYALAETALASLMSSKQTLPLSYSTLMSIGAGLLIMSYTIGSYTGISHKEWRLALHKHGAAFVYYAMGRKKKFPLNYEEDKLTKDAKDAFIWLSKNWSGVWI